MKWLRLALILVALVALVSFSVAACDDDPSTGSGQADDDNNDAVDDDNDDAADDDLTDDDNDDATDDDDDDDNDDNDDNDNDDDLSPPTVGIGEPSMHALLELFGANESFGYHWSPGGWSAGETWDVGAYGVIAQKGGDMWGAERENIYLVGSFLYYVHQQGGQFFWPVIMRFDGSNWGVDKVPLFWAISGNFAAVHGNQDVVYAAGFSALPEHLFYFVYKNDGDDWRRDVMVESHQRPHDIWVADDGVVIVVAALGNESNPTVIEKRGSQWVEKEVDVPGRCVLYGVWGTDSQNVWLAGSCGYESEEERPLLVFYDGETFTETTVPDSETMGWRQIAGHEDGTMYLASWGKRPGSAPYMRVAVLYFDGDVWRNTNIPTESEREEITSMWLSEESGLYVTKHEELWRYYNDEWQKLPSPELMQIWGVDHSSP